MQYTQWSWLDTSVQCCSVWRHYLGENQSGRYSLYQGSRFPEFTRYSRMLYQIISSKGPRHHSVTKLKAYFRYLRCMSANPNPEYNDRMASTGHEDSSCPVQSPDIRRRHKLGEYHIDTLVDTRHALPVGLARGNHQSPNQHSVSIH